MIEVLVTFAEFFQARYRWEDCARWCERAIAVARGLPNQPAMAAASNSLARMDMAGPSGSTEGAEEEAAAVLLLASLLTLRGNFVCRGVPQPGFLLCSEWFLLQKCVLALGA